MAQVTVRESGGDYNDLRSAITAGETDILIAGPWTANDQGSAVQPNAPTLIRYDAEAKETYVLESSGTDVIQLNTGSTGSDIEIPEIHSSSFGNHRGIRWFAQGISARFANIKFTAANQVAHQHPLYCQFANGSGVIENCWASGWGEGFLRVLNGNAHTFNVDLIGCTAHGNGTDATNAYGGIQLEGGNADTTINLRMFNCSITGQVTGDDFTITGTPNNITTTLDSCIDSDGTIATFDPTATNCISNVTPTDADDPGAGSFIVFQDITNAPFDLRLKSHASNVAQDAHPNSTGAGLTMPALDFDGVSRPQNTLYDIGAFEVVAAAQPPAIELIGQESSATPGANVETYTHNRTTPVQENDIVLLAVTVGRGGRVITLPAGFTSITGDLSAEGSVTTNLCYRICTDSEPSSYQFDWVNSAACSVIAEYHRNTDLAQGPVDSFLTGSGSSNPHVAPALTPTVDDCRVVAGFGRTDSGGDAMGYPGAPWEDGIEAISGGSSNDVRSALVAQPEITPAASSGTAEFSLSNGRRYDSWTVAIKPLVGADATLDISDQDGAGSQDTITLPGTNNLQIDSQAASSSQQAVLVGINLATAEYIAFSLALRAIPPVAATINVVGWEEVDAEQAMMNFTSDLPGTAYVSLDGGATTTTPTPMVAGENLLVVATSEGTAYTSNTLVADTGQQTVETLENLTTLAKPTPTGSGVITNGSTNLATFDVTSLNMGVKIGQMAVIAVTNGNGNAQITEDGSTDWQPYAIPETSSGVSTVHFYRIIDGTEATSYSFRSSKTGQAWTLGWFTFEKMDNLAPLFTEFTNMQSNEPEAAGFSVGEFSYATFAIFSQLRQASVLKLPPGWDFHSYGVTTEAGDSSSVTTAGAARQWLKEPIRSLAPAGQETASQDPSNAAEDLWVVFDYAPGDTIEILSGRKIAETTLKADDFYQSNGFWYIKRQKLEVYFDASTPNTHLVIVNVEDDQVLSATEELKKESIFEGEALHIPAFAPRWGTWVVEE